MSVSPLQRTDGWGRRVAAAVGDGVWMTAIPFPSTLSYSHSFSIRTDAGLLIIDLGWDSDEAWQSFLVGLTRAGAALDDVIGVLVTHSHPDHYGLAGRLREHSNAWIAMHPAEGAQVIGPEHERRERVLEMVTWLRRCGVPTDETDRLREEMAAIAATLPSVAPDLHLLDGQPVPGSSNAITAIHTPGHTNGHLCFHDKDRNLVFTGDHLLPRITPNVSRRPGSAEDPLLDYAASLGRLAGLPAPLVMPGHEWPFDRLNDRLTVLERHHHARLREVADSVNDGCRTLWEVTQAISWSRPFTTLDPRGRRQAIGETYAHLTRLANDGRLALTEGMPDRWAPVNSPRPSTIVYDI